MIAAQLGTIALFSALVACQGDKGAQSGALFPVSRGSGASSSTAAKIDSAVPVAHVPTPDTLRGLYVNRWAALGSKLDQLIGVAKRTEINALVIDVKDDRGFVLYRSSVPLAREIGADTNHTMSAARVRALLDTLFASNIYPIARIVVAKDPLLAQAKLAWAIKKK